MKMEIATGSIVEPESAPDAMQPRERGGCAEECRARGLQAGDVIVRRSFGKGWWADSRRELLWLGDWLAVWRCWRRTSVSPQWCYVGESSEWLFGWQDWRLVSRANPAASQSNQSQQTTCQPNPS